MLASNEVQAYIASTMKGDNTLTNLANIYDDVPDNTSFPYVVIGESHEGPFKTHSRNGELLTQTFHIWSRAEGFKEAKAIAEAIRPLFDAVSFTTASFSGFSVRTPGANDVWMVDRDGHTRHGVIEFDFYAHELGS